MGKKKREKKWLKEIHKLTYTYEPTHQVRLTAGDIDVLVAQCETEAFKHLVSPRGNPARRAGWIDLAERLRKSKEENASWGAKGK
jgi:hypothetical protein